MSTRTLVEGTNGHDRIDLSGRMTPHHIKGYGGNDTIFAGNGGDILEGGSGHDILWGGTGNDILHVGTGSNQYHGGAGQDTLLGTGGDDHIRVLALSGIERIDGGAGTDVLFAGNNSISWDFSGITLASVELIDLGSGWNRFVGTAGNDRITAGRKNDTIDGGTGFDEMVYAGAHADYTIAQNGNRLIVQGPDGRDTLTNIERLTFTDGVWEDGAFQPGTGGGGTNRAPVANTDVITTTAGKAVTFNPLANDSDPDGDTLAVATMGTPANGSLSHADGQWTYTPAAGFTGIDSFGYSLTDGALTASATISITVTPATGGGGGDGVVSQALWNKLVTITEGGWGRLNDNTFRSVWPDAADAAQGGYPRSVIQAWSSMAWDSNRNDLIFWGGGHANYGGNEVYRFDADTLMWERASLPTRNTATANPVVTETVDGPLHSPVSSHTYDNNEFLPIADRFVTFGGAAWNSGSAFVITDASGGTRVTGPYFWNPAKADANKVGGLSGTGTDPSRAGGQMWDNRDSVHNPDGSNPRPFVNGTTAYAEIDGKDVIFISDRPTGGLWKYTVHDVDDASKDTWEKVGRGWEVFDGAGTGAYSTADNLYIRSANKTFTYWDLDTAGAGNRNVIFTPTDLSGGFTMSALTGMDYDAGRDRFLLWSGTRDVWELKAPEIIGRDGWTVKKVAAGAAGPTGVPDVSTVDGNTTGILGKWKYVADLDLFLGVHDHNSGDIWAYKPHDWSPDVILA